MPKNTINPDEKYRNYGYKICKKVIKNLKITLTLSSFEDIFNHKPK